MGLFSFLKSTPALPAQADDAFNPLSAALDRDADASARTRLWTAVFALPEWHFLDFAMKGAKPIAPMHTSYNDRSAVLLYTSRQRAEIASKHYNETVKVMSFAPLSMPRNEALARICQLGRDKPEFALFNPGTGGHGFAETLGSMAAMSDFYLDELPEPGLYHLAKMAANVPDPTPTTRLIRRLAKLPTWHFIPDPDHTEIPHLITTADGTPSFTMYTSFAQVLHAISADPDLKNRKPQELPPMAAIAHLAAAQNRSGGKITTVTINPGPFPFTLPIEKLST